jgi:hypothetical protein
MVIVPHADFQPDDVDGRKIIDDLNECGHVEIYGYPANGRVIGTTWLHIEDTPRYTVPEAKNVMKVGVRSS